MIDYKHWTLRHFGNVLTLGIILVVIIAVFTMFVSPILVSVLPTVFHTGLTLTDTLLFMLLIVLLHTHK